MVVVGKSAETDHFGVERFFAGMAEWGMPKVVGESERFGQILVETERSADRARNLCYLETMGQPGAVMIALVIDEYLRLMGQPAKRSGMNDAIAVALKHRPHRMFRFRMEASACLLRLRRIGRERSDHSPNLAPTGPCVHRWAPSREEQRRFRRHARFRAAYEADRFGLTAAHFGNI